MPESNGKAFIGSLKKRWSGYNLAALLLLSLAVTLVLTVFLNHALSVAPWWGLLFFAITASLLTAFFHWWKITEQDVSRLLNRTFPELEESSQLLLKPGESLNFLEKLQFRKVDQVISGIATPAEVTKRLKSAAMVLAGAIILSVVLAWVPYDFSPAVSSALSKLGISKKAKPAPMLPEIESVAILITPPAYTHRSPHKLDGFALVAEESASVSWKVKTNKAVKKLHFLLNGKQVLPLTPVNDEHTEWAVEKVLTAPGFYQVSCNGNLSDLYKMEVTHDQAPAIKILAPEQYTYVDAGESHKIRLKLALTDDYGISEASIAATIASGKGEGVSFREQTIAFDTRFDGKQLQYRLEKILDLDRLKMQPGDELYFYVKARDNHRQENRTDIYFISIQDTAELMSMEGIASGVNKVPEYFRSQRQIIIDTEKLLKDKDTISVESFNARSNNIGIDQKLLRLRYSKFLGQESEDEPDGADHDDHDAGASDPADFNNESKLMEQYAHKHDNAEDATFLDPEQKKQMRDMLSEMWGAELRLRTYKTAAALPYEYRALRMLKELQQQSRVYVAKTTYKVPPLKPEKRLTGELEKITDPVALRKLAENTNNLAMLRSAASLLDRLREGERLNPASLTLLSEANLELNTRAAQQPSVYLDAASAMRKIIALGASRQADPRDIRATQAALQRIIGKGVRVPAAGKATAGTSLSDQYFRNLQPGNR